MSLPSQSGPQRAAAETAALEVVSHVATLVGALQMIEQGYVYRGPVRYPLDAEGMRAVARTALGED